MLHKNIRCISFITLAVLCTTSLCFAGDFGKDPVALRLSLDKFERTTLPSQPIVTVFGTNAHFIANAQVATPFSISADSALTYDTNPLTTPGGSQHAWHFDEEINLAYALLPEKSQWRASLIGNFTGSRYEKVSTEDFDSISAGFKLGTDLTEGVAITLQNIGTRAFGRGFHSPILSRDRISLSLELDLIKLLKVTKDGGWSITATPAIRRDFHDKLAADRVRPALNIEISREVFKNTTITFGATESYTRFDNSKHILVSECYAKLEYALSKHFSVNFSGNYLSQGGSSGRVIEFTGGPAISVSGKF